MRKKYLFVAAAAAMLAACSSKDSIESAPTGGAPQASLPEGAVGFTAYTNRSVTRAGNTGLMTTGTLQQNPTEEQKRAGYKAGFGVFAFYTDNNDYDPLSVPNFMYNQQVTYGTNGWEYEPLKYWPNEYGDNAISDDQDKVSFFAYAPYVEVTPSTGKIVCSTDSAKWGIAGLTRNSATGDPIVKYIASFDASTSVDLLWAVCDQPKDWPIVNTGSNQQPYINDGVAGLPWLNVQHPAQIDQRLKFTFKHALSQLNVNIDTFADTEDHAASADARTKVFVRSISFTGIASKGSLNLNNIESDKALWLDYNGLADLESGEAVTVYDGRKDGKEGVQNATASNEKTLGFNPTVISDDGNTQEGVTGTTKNLFVGNDPIYIIPTGEEIEVEIVYDVETEDDNLSTYLSDRKTLGSSIENRIRKSVSFGGNNTFENGKHYTINLHLGLNSVKLDAAVSDWVEAEASADVDLPLNVPAFAAASSSPQTAIELPATLAQYDFAITGLNGSEGVTATPDGTVVTALDVIQPTNVSGQAIIRGTLDPNMTVHNVTTNSAATITGNASGLTHTLNITQRAHALELSATAINSSYGTITLGAGATGINWSADVAADGIHVSKNGSALTKVDGDPVENEFRWNAGDHSFDLGKAAVAGDVFEITVKAGDADEETISVKIGGLSFAGTRASIMYGTSGFNNGLTMAGVSAVTFTSSDAGVATVDANGTVTTVAVGSARITAIPTAESGYLVPAGRKTYILTVTAAAGCRIAATAANQVIPAASIVGTDLSEFIKLYNADGCEITPGTAGGSVNYVITAQSYAAGSPAPTVSTRRIKLGSDGKTIEKYGNHEVYTPVAGDVYTITATVTDGTAASYTTTTAPFTITVQ